MMPRVSFIPVALGLPPILVLAASLVLPAPAAAQEPVRTDGRVEVFAGSEMEEYLRYLQSEGAVGAYPWSIRSFSPHELDRLAVADTATHPWARRYSLTADTASGLRIGLVPPSVRMLYNSAFPYGQNDGAVWAGRGVTTVLQAGFTGRLGPASVTIAPTIFQAENADFEIHDNKAGGLKRFGAAEGVFFIDLPQRFGDAPYRRIDPGQSTARLDLRGVAVGISTANQSWGPASEHPVLLGNNAAGFPHAFVGTSSPVDLWIGTVHTRVVWGRVGQSEYADVEGVASNRFMAGMVGSFTPRGVPGLELGAARFFHTPWPERGLSVNDFVKPLENILKAYLPERDKPSGTIIPEERKSDNSNQLASVFLRWVLPRSGFEVYGEFGREDHNYNLRDVAVQLDHHAAYMVGARKVWRHSPTRFTAMRAELIDAQPSHLLLVREQYPFYIHGTARQGHTSRGQLLGSYAGYGGAGSVVALDRYSPWGRAALSWRRIQQREQFSHLRWSPQRAWIETDAADPDAVDVIHSLGVDLTRFLGPLTLFVGAHGVYNLNRYFADDAFNLNLGLGGSYTPR